MIRILDKIKNEFFVYKIYVKNDIKSQITYSLDFWIQMIVWFVYTMIPFMGLKIIFSKFENVGIWNVYSVGILYSIVGLAYDTSRMIGRAFDDFHKLLITGDLDVFYIRPYSIIVQLFGSKFFIRRIAGLIQYFIVLIYSLINMKDIIFISLKNLFLVLIVSYFSTLLIFISLLLIYSSICFITIQRNLFSDIVIDSTAEIGYYPLDYSFGFIKFIFFTIIPIGLTTYLPIKYIILAENFNGYKYIYLFISAIVGLVMLLVSKFIFTFSLRFYNSVNN
jgi:ABC-2 type transport system permease protein